MSHSAIRLLDCWLWGSEGHVAHDLTWLPAQPSLWHSRLCLCKRKLMWGAAKWSPSHILKMPQCYLGVWCTGNHSEHPVLLLGTTWASLPIPPGTDTNLPSFPWHAVHRWIVSCTRKPFSTCNAPQDSGGPTIIVCVCGGGECPQYHGGGEQGWWEVSCWCRVWPSCLPLPLNSSENRAWHGTGMAWRNQHRGQLPWTMPWAEPQLDPQLPQEEGKVSY